MPFTRVSPKVTVLHHVLSWIYNVPRGPVLKGVVPRTAVLKQIGYEDSVICGLNHEWLYSSKVWGQNGKFRG